MNSQIPQAENQGDAEDIWLDKAHGNQGAAQPGYSQLAPGWPPILRLPSCFLHLRVSGHLQSRPVEVSSGFPYMAMQQASSCLSIVFRFMP